MQKTDIDFLDYTWNPTHGCSKVSDGCRFCWAERMSRWLAGMDVNGYSRDDPFKVTFCPEKLDEPLKVKKPSRIGVSFMGDLFHEQVPFGFVKKVIHEIGCCGHTFLVLTKRPQKVFEYLLYQQKLRELTFGYRELAYLMPENLWLGISAENQQAFDDRWHWLKQIPASHKWISYEPGLGPVDLGEALFCETCNKSPSLYGKGVVKDDYNNAMGGKPWINCPECSEGNYPKIYAVVCGGETGPGARPMDIAWPRKLRDDCRAAGVPFWFKQMSGKKPIPDDLKIKEWPE